MKTKETPKASVIKHNNAKRYSQLEKLEHRSKEAYENFKRPAYEVTDKKENRKE